MKKSYLADWLQGLANHATPNLAECILVLGQELPLLQQFSATPQDAEWHAEGDVYIHTDMVLNELYRLLATDAAHICGEQRQALILGTLLHDIAKPLQTRTVEIAAKMRIASPQHESVGRSWLVFKLMSWPLSFQVIWQVINLVGEHHMPKFLAIKAMAAHHYWRIARHVDMELLYFLEVADMRGRICHDQEMQLLYLEEFKSCCQQYGVWGKSLDIRHTLMPFIESFPVKTQNYVYAHTIMQLEQGRIFSPEEGLATTYQHRADHAQVLMLCGPSGSGKSSWLAKHHPKTEIISLDNLRAEINGNRSSQANKGLIIQTAKQQLRLALQQKKTVIWDATNLRRDFRDMISQLAQDYHAVVTLVVFLLPEPLIYQQNQQRKYAIPEAVLQQQLASYQFPLLTEAHHYQVIGSQGQMLWHSGYWEREDVY